MSKARLLSLAPFGEWTISFPSLDELIWRVVCTSTPQPSDHYGQTGPKLCGSLILTTLGTELSAFLGATRAQEGVFVWNPLMSEFFHWLWRILCVIQCIHNICKDTWHTNQLIQEEKANMHPWKLKKNVFILHYFYRYLQHWKRQCPWAPFSMLLSDFFEVYKYLFTCKSLGWIISALHHFLDHTPSGRQNSQKSSLYPSELHIPENK